MEGTDCTRCDATITRVRLLVRCVVVDEIKDQVGSSIDKETALRDCLAQLDHCLTCLDGLAVGLAGAHLSYVIEIVRGEIQTIEDERFSASTH